MNSKKDNCRYFAILIHQRPMWRQITLPRTKFFHELYKIDSYTKKIYTKFEISCLNYKCKNMKKKTDIDFTAIFIQVDIGGIRKISMFIDFNLLTEHGKTLIPHVQFLEALCGKVAEGHGGRFWRRWGGGRHGGNGGQGRETVRAYRCLQGRWWN